MGTAPVSHRTDYRDALLTFVLASLLVMRRALGQKRHKCFVGIGFKFENSYKKRYIIEFKIEIYMYFKSIFGFWKVIFGFWKV